MANENEEEKKKIFNDPIHGYISLPDLCIKIIDTPQFQRLRYIKQLGGCYFVYPGASNNRFEHSIGVSWLAWQLVKDLKERQDELNITDSDVLCVSIAGLCHDLGHGPFSHLFDALFIPKIKPGSKWKHEDASVAMFDYLIKSNNLKEEFTKARLDETDITFIKELIKPGPVKEGRKAKWFLYEIVANSKNGIDVDKWDYFARDCHHLGVKISFDHRRLINYARVITENDESHICFIDKEVHNLYDMFYTRYMLHRRAYQHKTNKLIEYLIAEALCKADEHIKIRKKDGEEVKMSDCIGDMEAFSRLNDTIYHQILYSVSTEKEMIEAREILENIERRELYKFIGETQISPENKKTQKEIEKEIAGKSAEDKIRDVDLIVQVIKFSYGKGGKNPIDLVKFYTKYNPNKIIELPRGQVSRMLPQQFEEHIVRLYCKDRGKKDIADKCFKEWCAAENETIEQMPSTSTDRPTKRPKLSK